MPILVLPWGYPWHHASRVTRPSLDQSRTWLSVPRLKKRIHRLHVLTAHTAFSEENGHGGACKAVPKGTKQRNSFFSRELLRAAEKRHLKSIPPTMITVMPSPWAGFDENKQPGLPG